MCYIFPAMDGQTRLSNADLINPFLPLLSLAALILSPAFAIHGLTKPMPRLRLSQLSLIRGGHRY